MKPYWSSWVSSTAAARNSSHVVGGESIPASANRRVFQNRATLLVSYGTAYCRPSNCADSTLASKKSPAKGENWWVMSANRPEAPNWVTWLTSSSMTSGPPPPLIAVVILSTRSLAGNGSYSTSASG